VPLRIGQPGLRRGAAAVDSHYHALGHSYFDSAGPDRLDRLPL
jgi:hypothetical protein